MSRSLCWWLSVICLVAGVCAQPQPGPRGLPTSPEQVHITLSGKNDQMVVSWVTFAATASLVEFNVYGSSDITNVTGSSYLYVDPMNNVTQRWMHTALLTGLAPLTRYGYRCGDPAVEKGFSDYFSFTTLQNADRIVNLIVFGDLGLVNSQSLQNLEWEVGNNTADLVLHLGDYAYDLHTNNGSIGDQYMNMVEPIVANSPYLGCIGNHEGKFNFSHFTNRFNSYNYLGANSGSGNNWFFSWEYISGGAKVHFAAINTEVYYVYVDEFAPPDLTAQLKAQYEWLQQDLATARQNGADWIVVYGHRPMYCSNNDGDCFTDADTLRTGVNGTTEYGMEQIIAKYNVDFYLTAHEHSYERTFPVFQGQWEKQDNHTYVNPQAPFHIIAGSAGCEELFDHFDDVFYGPWSAVRSATYGYAHLQVHNKTHLHWEQFIDEGRQGTDELWVVKKQ